MRTVIQELKLAASQGYYIFLNDYGYRYGLSFLGYLWALARPLAATFPFILVGSHFDFVSKDSPISFPVYAITGLLMWTWFWDAVSLPMNLARRARRILASLEISEYALIFATFYAALINLLTLSVIWLIVLAVQRQGLSLMAVWLVPGLLFFFFLGISIGLVLVPLSCVYQDFNMAMSFASSLLFWSLPVVHEIPSSGLLATINRSNPLTYLMSPIRDWMYLGSSPNAGQFGMVALIVFPLFTICFLYYQRVIRNSLDYVL